MFELMDAHSQSAVIKVIGVGGGGGNAVSHMVDTGIEGVDFVCAKTDSHALKGSRVRTSLQIGCNIAKGLGAGSDRSRERDNARFDRHVDRVEIDSHDPSQHVLADLVLDHVVGAGERSYDVEPRNDPDDSSV